MAARVSLFLCFTRHFTVRVFPSPRPAPPFGRFHPLHSCPRPDCTASRRRCSGFAPAVQATTWWVLATIASPRGDLSAPLWLGASMPPPDSCSPMHLTTALPAAAARLPPPRSRPAVVAAPSVSVGRCSALRRPLPLCPALSRAPLLRTSDSLQHPILSLHGAPSAAPAYLVLCRAYAFCNRRASRHRSSFLFSEYPSVARLAGWGGRVGGRHVGDLSHSLRSSR